MNWYRRAQGETGTPGAPEMIPNTGMDPAPAPNPQTGVEDATQYPQYQEPDYEGLDQEIRNKILGPLYQFYNAFDTVAYTKYTPIQKPFMLAFIPMSENDTLVGMMEILNSYNNSVSPKVRGGTPDPALSSWMANLLDKFPEGDAKTVLRKKLDNIMVPVAMQEQPG